MIEKIVFDYLNQALSVDAYMEKPNIEDRPAEYVLIEKTGGSSDDKINGAVIALQSYADSLHRAAEINESVKDAMEGIVSLPSVFGCRLNSDYNFTDTAEKKYRYQAVFELWY